MGVVYIIAFFSNVNNDGFFSCVATCSENNNFSFFDAREWLGEKE